MAIQSRDNTEAAILVPFVKSVALLHPDVSQEGLRKEPSTLVIDNFEK